MVNVIDRCTIQSVATVPSGMQIDAASAATARCTGAQSYDVAVARTDAAPVLSTSQLTGIGEDAQSHGGYVLFSDAAHGGAMGGSVEVDPLARADGGARPGASARVSVADPGVRAIDAVSVTVSF